MRSEDVDNRKRRVIFSKADDGNVYAISVTNNFIDEIIKLKNTTKENKFSSEAIVLNMDNQYNISVKMVKNENKDLFEQPIISKNIKDSVYFDVYNGLFESRSLINDYRIKLVLWRGQSHAITTGFDIPMEVHLYKLGTYSIIRIPVEESVYTHLVRKEELTNFWDIRNNITK